MEHKPHVIPSLGAIHKSTGNYASPVTADKKESYCCPECNADVILKKGLIKRPHFAHKQKRTCNFFDKPSESQVHKDAQKLLKHVIEQNGRLVINQHVCKSCKSSKSSVPIREYDSLSAIRTEYEFLYKDSRKRADVAFLHNGELVYIFEIMYSHKTRECDRPEPWFEFNATELISTVNALDSISGTEITLNCIRSDECETCKTTKLSAEQRRIDAVIQAEQKRIDGSSFLKSWQSNQPIVYTGKGSVYNMASEKGRIVMSNKEYDIRNILNKGDICIVNAQTRTTVVGNSENGYWIHASTHMIRHISDINVIIDDGSDTLFLLQYERIAPYYKCIKPIDIFVRGIPISYTDFVKLYLPETYLPDTTRLPRDVSRDVAIINNKEEYDREQEAKAREREEKAREREEELNRIKSEERERIRRKRVISDKEKEERRRRIAAKYTEKKELYEEKDKMCTECGNACDIERNIKQCINNRCSELFSIDHAFLEKYKFLVT